MHLSYSEDIIQRIRAQQTLSKTMYFLTPTPDNPELRHNNHNKSNKPRNISPNSIPRSQQPSALASLLQRPINYNECIGQTENNSGNRYRLRNCRQPQLKIVDSTELMNEKMKGASSGELKQLMK